MKPIKVTLLFFAVVLNFCFCETTQLRNLHDRELRAELGKYSDALDLVRTEIHFDGMGYYLFGVPPSIYLSLYVKSDHINRETLFTIRDGLINFFSNCWDTTTGRYSFTKKIAINFTLGETKTYYSVLHYSTVWVERWYSELFGKPLRENNYIAEDSKMSRFGKPLMVGTIQELDTMLHPYINSMDVEQYDGYYFGTRFKIWLLIPYNYNRETVLAIRDGFVNFFENNRQELIEKYGQFNTISITFYRVEDIIRRITDRKQMEVKTEIEVYKLLYENNEWLERWESERDYKPFGENSILME
jgi:hypothetical protein